MQDGHFRKINNDKYWRERSLSGFRPIHSASIGSKLKARKLERQESHKMIFGRKLKQSETECAATTGVAQKKDG